MSESPEPLRVSPIYDSSAILFALRPSTLVPGNERVLKPAKTVSTRSSKTLLLMLKKQDYEGFPESERCGYIC